MPDYPLHPDIDLNGALQRLGGRHAMLERLLDSYLKRYADAVTVLDQHESAANFEEAAGLAHEIKGAGLNLGADGVARHAAILEQGYKSGDCAEHGQLDTLTIRLNELAEFVAQNRRA